MINLQKIRQVRQDLSEEITNNLDLSGKRPYYLLCCVANDLNLLIKELENPKKQKKITSTRNEAIEE